MPGMSCLVEALGGGGSITWSGSVTGKLKGKKTVTAVRLPAAKVVDDRTQITNLLYIAVTQTARKCAGAVSEWDQFAIVHNWGLKWYTELKLACLIRGGKSVRQ